MFCGKIASGKSSLAQQLAASPRSVLISEDFLMSRLYPNEINTVEDYSRSAPRLCEAIGPLVQSLLRAGLDVILDFHANTLPRRAWMRGLVEGAGADHQLHYLRASDDVCRARLRTRNSMGAHEYQTTDAIFELFNSKVVAPSPDEGFKLLIHDQDPRSADH
jgi:predicted kinase